MSVLKKNKTIIATIVCLILAYLVVLSYGRICLLEGAGSYYGGKYFGYNAGSVVMYIGAVVLQLRFWKSDNVRSKWTAVFGGVPLAAAVVYGAYAHFVNNIFISFRTSLLQLGMIAAFSTVAIPLFHEFFGLMDLIAKKISAREGLRKEPLPAGKKVRFFLISWLAVFLAFMPLFLCEWPGNFNVDAPYQLLNVITGDYKTHHPLAHTLLMGTAYKFGCSIGNAAMGYQIYTLIQMLVLSSSFAYAGLYLYGKFKTKTVWLPILLWYALFPMHMVFAITSTKDVLFAAFFVYFTVFVIRFFTDGVRFRWFDYVGFILSGTGALLYRNNMSYALILAGVFVVLLIKGGKKKLLAAGLIIAIYLSANLCNGIMVSATNAYEGGKYRETLSIPLQCLARVADYRRDELDDGLYEEICMYMEPDKIDAYNPYVSDAVKNTANEELLRTNLFNFLKLFVKVGIQFPDEYLESVITNTFGYWYPLPQGFYVSADVATYHTLIGMGEEIEKQSKLPFGTEAFQWMFWAQNYRNLPLVGFFFRNAIYFWGLVAYMLWCLKQQRRELWAPGIFAFVYFASCFAGPMAALRYIYCIVAVMPLLLGLMLRHAAHDLPEQNPVKDT
ncbi:MAG: hypothetical protein E7288_01420 [Lachnospiraceae bacterium]|nr:hypothetical protein [Lachnospiraceae bacterium]